MRPLVAHQPKIDQFDAERQSLDRSGRVLQVEQPVGTLALADVHDAFAPREVGDERPEQNHGKGVMKRQCRPFPLPDEVLSGGYAREVHHEQQLYQVEKPVVVDPLPCDRGSVTALHESGCPHRCGIENQQNGHHRVGGEYSE